MLADALGRPLRVIVTPGQASDVAQAAALLDGQTGAAVLADKAYDSNEFRDQIAAMKAKHEGQGGDPIQEEPQGVHPARHRRLQAP